MNKKRIWIVSELFYPDEASTGYIMTVIAKFIAEDYDVHIICGPSGYDKLNADKTDQNFRFTIHRIRTLNFDKNNISGRLFRLIFLSLGMFFKGLFSIKYTDTVLIVTNPAFVIPFYAVVKRIKKNKLIFLVHDVFPENLIPSGIIKSSNNFIYKLTKSIFDWSYCQADRLIVLGADMLEIMRGKTNPDLPVTIIENWANITDIQPEPYQFNPLVKQYGLEDKIVFTFAGNMGRVQGLEFLFNIIKQIRNPRVHFLFVGSGALLNEFSTLTSLWKITNVTFAGTMPRNQQHVFLNAAHFGLVTLSAAIYGLGVPSKSYNIMAAGKPILFIGNKKSEIGKMVIEEACGYSFEDGEEIELLNFFNGLDQQSILDAEIMGIHSRRLAETKYSEAHILNKFKKILND